MRELGVAGVIVKAHQAVAAKQGRGLVPKVSAPRALGMSDERHLMLAARDLYFSAELPRDDVAMRRDAVCRLPQGVGIAVNVKEEIIIAGEDAQAFAEVEVTHANQRLNADDCGIAAAQVQLAVGKGDNLTDTDHIRLEPEAVVAFKAEWRIDESQIQFALVCYGPGAALLRNVVAGRFDRPVVSSVTDGGGNAPLVVIGDIAETEGRVIQVPVGGRPNAGVRAKARVENRHRLLAHALPHEGNGANV